MMNDRLIYKGHNEYRQLVEAPELSEQLGMDISTKHSYNSHERVSEKFFT